MLILGIPTRHPATKPVPPWKGVGVGMCRIGMFSYWKEYTEA